MTAARSVPRSVPNSTSSAVKVLQEPQLGPYEPMSGSSIAPVVPRSDDQRAGDVTGQPEFGYVISAGSPRGTTVPGSPSVPGMNGTMFRKGPADPHYLSEIEVTDPYAKVNNPPTQGRWQWVKDYLNHIGLGTQNTDMTGMRQLGAQQRTSYMRPLLPPHGSFGTETFEPRQLPQSARTQRFLPQTGSDLYGTGVLNSDTFGAGQTAGGIGGNNYTPPALPPVTSPVSAPDASGMPTWG